MTRGREDGGAWFELGLSQRRQARRRGARVYRHALERVLLPRLIWRLEAQMHGAIDRPDYLYEATRVYLMLGARRGRSTVIWCRLDVARLAGQLSRRIHDEGCGRTSRSTSKRCSPNRCRRSPSTGRCSLRLARPSAEFRSPTASIPALSPPARRKRPAVAPGRCAGGGGGARLCARLGQTARPTAFPGFYTVDGFHKVLLPALGDVTKQVASESWVLGSRSQLPPTAPRRSGSNAM